MKKLALILLLFIGMTLSFVAIGLVILFATGAVTSMDEARALLTGQTPGQESAFLKPDEVTVVQDGLLLLQQQKMELEGQINTLTQNTQTLTAQHDSLSLKLKDLAGQTEAGNEAQAKQRQERLEQAKVLYGAMRPADAAAILDQMTDEKLVLDILTGLKERQAARILNALQDDQKKARLSELMVEGKVKAN